jgi:hypothetical protein
MGRMDRDDRLVKIRYNKDETGWAEHLGGNRYRLDNIPLARRLNIDDVVLCRLNDEGQLQVRKLVRRRYPCKTGFRYDTIQQYHAVRKRAKEAGAQTESYFGPADGEQGFAICAHGHDFNPLEAAREAGVENPELGE